MLFDGLTRIPRYERQLQDVEELVMHDAKISKERLYEVLEVLYEYRIID